MKAVILAAGNSSRFSFFTTLGHKSLVTILGKPLIVHTLLSIKKSGITDVILVQDQTKQIEEIIGDGRDLGISIQYVIHKDAKGAGAALLDAQQYITSDFFLVYPYHINFSLFTQNFITTRKHADEIILLGKKERDIKDYGDVYYEGDKVLSLTEKPAVNATKSHTRIVGIYLLNRKFLEILSSVPLDHYSLENAIDIFAKKYSARIILTKEETMSLKYPWNLLYIKDYMLRNLKRNLSSRATIAKNVEIIGDVCVEDGVQIFEGACIKGPCYIGKNVVIGNNAVIRNGVSIEMGCTVGSGMEVKNSLILENTTTHSGFIGDSVIGKKCKIAAYFCTGNVRLDRNNVSIAISQKKIETTMHSLGVIMGDNVKVGLRVSTMPGVTIGKHSIIGPSTTVLHTVDPDMRYYTKFKEVVQYKEKGKIILFDIDHTLFDTEEFKRSELKKYMLYEEVERVLEKISKVATVGIFSQGDALFQTKKLLKTNIQNYFLKKHIHLFEEKESKLEGVLNKYSSYSIYLVDDKLPILHKAKQYLPSVKTIWIKRGIYADKQGPINNFIPDGVITNLEEIIPLVTGFE